MFLIWQVNRATSPWPLVLFRLQPLNRCKVICFTLVVNQLSLIHIIKMYTRWLINVYTSWVLPDLPIQISAGNDRPADNKLRGSVHIWWKTTPPTLTGSPLWGWAGMQFQDCREYWIKTTTFVCSYSTWTHHRTARVPGKRNGLPRRALWSCRNLTLLSNRLG